MWVKSHHPKLNTRFIFYETTIFWKDVLMCFKALLTNHNDKHNNIPQQQGRGCLSVIYYGAHKKRILIAAHIKFSP